MDNNRQPYHHNYYMQIALKHADKALALGHVPVAAIIVNKDKQIIAQAHNDYTLCDPTAHAEIIALRRACAIVQSHRLDGYSIYVTLEPCAMCAAAISCARIANVFYAASDKKGGAIDSNLQLYEDDTCHHKPNVYCGIYEKQASMLLQKFFNAKRLEAKCNTK